MQLYDLSHMILGGLRTITLWQKVGGSNRWPHSLIWEKCGNTLVNEDDYHRFNMHRWIMCWNSTNQNFYARRMETSNGQRVTVILAREILGLPRNPGYGAPKADHINFDTLDNRGVDNLRVATPSQSSANTRRQPRIRTRFKGVQLDRKGKYMARIQFQGIVVCLPMQKSEIESAVTYRLASEMLFGEYGYVDELPADELPSEDRVEQLRGMVEQSLLNYGIVEKS